MIAMPTVGLVLPTTSYRGPDFVAAADELGIDLVVATEGSIPMTSGRIVGVVSIDCDDPGRAADELLAGLGDVELDAVVGVDDGGVQVAALAADRLGLRHNAPEAVAATRDKAVMRRLLAAAGVPQPAFAVAAAIDGVPAAAASVGYPVVVKPASLSASRGVMRVDGPEDIEAAAARLGRIQEDAGVAGEHVLVEEFVAGPEIAVEALLSPEGLEVLAVFDKPDALDGPFFEETVYVTPSRHDPALVSGAVEAVRSASTALGLAFGPVHAETRLTDDGPRVIEVAARSIGGLCGRALRFGMLEQSLEVLLLRAALGMNRRGMRPVERASGAMMIPIPGAGTLRAVRGTEAVAEVEGIVDITITVPRGRHIDPLPEGDRYLGFIIAAGEEPEQVERSLREAHSLLDIQLDGATR